MRILAVVTVLGLCALVSGLQQEEATDELTRSIAELLQRTRRSPAKLPILHRVKRMLQLEEPELSRVKRNRRSTYGEPALVRVKRGQVEEEVPLSRVKRQKRSLRDISLNWLRRKKRDMEDDSQTLRMQRQERVKAKRASEKELQRSKRMPKNVQLSIKQMVKRMMSGNKEEFKEGMKKLRQLRKSLKRAYHIKENNVQK